ncbi:non-specific serine/threonine protein kinase [Actinomyces sp. oral taxon 178 str. F0338]|nr:non-specific serine/threonine protein kinase [Actinomyces sp. oral taxon 178 str. F0338]
MPHAGRAAGKQGRCPLGDTARLGGRAASRRGSARIARARRPPVAPRAIRCADAPLHPIGAGNRALGQATTRPFSAPGQATTRPPSAPGQATAHWGRNCQAAQRIGAGNRASGQATTRPPSALGQATEHRGRQRPGRPVHRGRQQRIGVGTARPPNASGQATEHRGRQIAYPNGWLSAPMPRRHRPAHR